MENFDSLWNFQDPAATEEAFKALAPSLEAKPELYWQLQTQIARAQGLQRKFDEAHSTLNVVEKQLDHPLTKIRYLLERGRVFNSSQKPDASFFKSAFEVATEIQADHYAIDAAHMLAIVDKDPIVQTYWNHKALKIAEASKEEKAQNWLGSLYNNIAWTHHNKGEFSEALDLFRKALAFREVRGNAQTIHVAKWSVARALRSLQDYKEALKIQISLESEDKPDGYVFEEIAELYFALNDKARAQTYFTLAYKELSKDPWFLNNELVRLERLRQMATAQV